MTEAQRKYLTNWAFFGEKALLAEAITAALAEVDALRKALEELSAPVEADAMCAELVKCGTFTETPKSNQLVNVAKSVYAELCKDRERINKIITLQEREHQSLFANTRMGWLFDSDGEVLSGWYSEDEYRFDTLRAAIDAVEVKR